MKTDQGNLIGKEEYYILLLGTSLMLMWIAVFRIFPTEANILKPLLENHLVTFFVYNKVHNQTVNDTIGVIEIILQDCYYLVRNLHH
ncbi:Protein of unknown function, DUF417 [Chryseobacterium profundimaris]|uniref:Uncharacterized protein n=1 Tax=Chryseobacterium profundimaris TaxID=1387275 RepID=A0ABY1P445_9FLAO|nr:Protein of unknown function, DUF417 [Chryseobacterium profundimaris]